MTRSFGILLALLAAGCLPTTSAQCEGPVPPDACFGRLVLDFQAEPIVFGLEGAELDPILLSVQRIDTCEESNKRMTTMWFVTDLGDSLANGGVPYGVPPEGARVTENALALAPGETYVVGYAKPSSEHWTGYFRLDDAVLEVPAARCPSWW